MDGFSEKLAELKELGVAVVAASTDPQDKAAEMAAKIGIPVGYGVDQATIEGLGGYWEPQREFAQPLEAVITPEGKIAQLSVSDGPLARTEAGDVIRMVNFIESQKK